MSAQLFRHSVVRVGVRMNGFDLHAITQTSATSINSWANAPDVWIAERLFGLRGPPLGRLRGLLRRKLVDVVGCSVGHCVTDAWFALAGSDVIQNIDPDKTVRSPIFRTDKNVRIID